MTDQTAMATRITLKMQAADFLAALGPSVRHDLIDAIREKAQHPDFQMVVSGMTCNLPDHIYRAMKWYVVRPGIRAIFYRTPDGIVIVKIAWRDQDPYGDGY